ncbi:MAG: 16S rRNA (guanine(966)-N(2))-methyltransferase RsmD [Myxococcota bacterium]
MRIVGGQWGGRRLTAPRGDATRPTSDRVREALFAIVGDLEDARVLDLCAGTGAVGLEALSRGAAHATFVEKGTPALKALGSNLAALGVPVDRHQLLRLDLRRAAARLGPAYDFIYADPPYDQVDDLTEPLLGVVQATLSPTGLAVIEHRSRDPAPKPTDALFQDDLRVYGETALAFYRRLPVST